MRFAINCCSVPTPIASWITQSSRIRPIPPVRSYQPCRWRSTWWTVKAYDRFGSTIYADPRLIRLPENKPPVADAGPDQVLYAGLDGKATVTLNGANSADPDGDALGYTWAWAIGGKAYLTNGVSLTIELPIGVHTIQLMVNDGHGIPTLMKSP